MKKVFRLLKKLGKPQVELAQFLGVEKGAVTNWKRGGNISPVHAKGIIRFFAGLGYEIDLNDIYFPKRRKNGRKVA